MGMQILVQLLGFMPYIKKVVCPDLKKRELIQCIPFSFKPFLTLVGIIYYIQHYSVLPFGCAVV